MTHTTTHITYTHRDPTVACTLEVGDRPSRAEEWRRLRDDSGLGVEIIDRALRIWPNPASWSAVDDLARRESECCAFLGFDLVAEGDRLYLDVTSPVPEGAFVIGNLLDADGRGERSAGCGPACC